MARKKTQAEFMVLAWPNTAIPRRQTYHYTIADQLHSLVVRDDSDSTGNQQSTPSGTQVSATEYQSNKKLKNLVNVEMVHLGGKAQEGVTAGATGNKDGLTGFVIKGREFPFNFIMEDDLAALAAAQLNPTVPNGSKFFQNLVFKHKKPTLPPMTNSKWETLVADKNAHSVLMHTKEEPDKVVEVESLGIKNGIDYRIPKNAHLRFFLHFFGRNLKQTKQAAFRIAWGSNTYSIVWRYGEEPRLEKMVNGQWVVWRRLEGAGQATFANGVQVQVTIRRLAGHIVIGLGDKSWDVMEAVPISGVADAFKSVDTQWPIGKLNFTGYGVSFTIGGSAIVYKDADTFDQRTGAITALGAPSIGRFEREIEWAENNTATGTAETGGWRQGGTSTSVAVTVANYKITYVCTLKASPNAIDTPFVSKVGGKSASQFAVQPVVPLDITAACLTARESTAEPGVTNGPEWTLDIDRHALKRLFPNWEDYVKRYNPIHIAVRHLYSDGTRGPWTYRLKGYIHSDTMNTESFRDERLSLALRGTEMRFTKPHSIIDHRYYPMDFLIFGKPSNELFGGEIVKEIVAITMGEQFASQLNGNGDPLRYFAPGHYPILGSGNDIGGYLQNSQAPSTSNWQLPAPWGQDPMSWINQISTMDYAVFFYGYPGTTSSITSNAVVEQVPIYGHYNNIVQSARNWDLSDAVLADGDQDFLIQSIETGAMPEWDINRVIVWGSLPTGNPGLLPVPAVFVGEDRLGPTDINAPEENWERTLLMQGGLYQSSDMCRAVARLTLSQWKNLKVRRVRLNFRGEPLMQWGDTITPDTNNEMSDTSLDVHNQVFRVIRLENSYDFQSGGPNAFRTTATCFPVSALGI